MFATINPSTNEKLKDYSYLSNFQIESTLDMAEKSFAQRSQLKLRERCDVLLKIANALKAHKAALSRQMSLEMGKPIIEAQAEVLKSASAFEYYAQAIPEIMATEKLVGNYKQVFLHKSSLGPVLGIMPWNFPLWQWARHAAPLIGGGGVSVLKHADNVAGFADLLAEVLQEAAPEVLFNLRIGHSQAAQVIADRRICGVSFTGSVRGGREVAILCAQNLKKSVLELGGNDAYLVWYDADLQLATESLLKARFLNAGQVCIAAKRIILHSKIADQFKSIFFDLAKKINVGNPLDPTTQMGPLAGLRYKKELGFQIETAVNHGAEYRVLQRSSQLGGSYGDIGVLEGVTPSADWNRVELFGPVVQITIVHDLQEAVDLINGTPYGLGAGIFSQDTEWARGIAEDRICAGFVAINDFVKTDPRVPFGGVRESGWGKELGMQGALEFMNSKSIGIN